MRVDYTPWARGALSEAQRIRLRLHLSDGLRLDIGAVTSPYRFVVSLYRERDGMTQRVGHKEDVGRAVLFERIEQMLSAAGSPLIPEEVPA